MELKGKKIVFLGDSITEGHGVSDRENTFVSRIGRECREAVNCGIGGTRIARQTNPSNERWDLDFCLRAKELDVDADAVVVFGGTNDFGHGDAPIGTFEDRTEYTFWGACHCLMQTLLERYPGKPILICTPIHRLTEDNPKGDGGKAEPTGPLSLYVNIIREAAAYYALPVLDLWAESGIQPKVPVIREKFCPDGLHPNDAGHALLAERILSKLRTL